MHRAKDTKEFIDGIGERFVRAWTLRAVEIEDTAIVLGCSELHDRAGSWPDQAVLWRECWSALYAFAGAPQSPDFSSGLLRTALEKFGPRLATIESLTDELSACSRDLGRLLEADSGYAYDRLFNHLTGSMRAGGKGSLHDAVKDELEVVGFAEAAQ